MPLITSKKKSSRPSSTGQTFRRILGLLRPHWKYGGRLPEYDHPRGGDRLRCFTFLTKRMHR